MINFHRLYGLTIEDICTGSRYESKTEVDVSRKQQFLDVERDILLFEI